MKKDSIIVGKHCMEQSDVILSLCSKYDLFTTDLVECDSLYIYTTSIRNITLSSGEMLQFMSFFSENKCLHKIGFTESSLLFVAKLRKIKVAAVDVVTQSVCNELGEMNEAIKAAVFIFLKMIINSIIQSGNI